VQTGLYSAPDNASTSKRELKVISDLRRQRGRDCVVDRMRFSWRGVHQQRCSSAHGNSHDDGTDNRCKDQERRDDTGPDERKEFPDLFLTYMLKRNVGIEADLMDQLFNSSEKRFGSALLLRERYGKEAQPEPLVGKISRGNIHGTGGTQRAVASMFS
jgi:hypothetical protein